MRSVFSVCLCATISLRSDAQVAPRDTSPAGVEADRSDIVVLTPFVVESDKDIGYAASSTLAGTRLRTELSDVGTSISVLTKEFLEDLGATDAGSALAYATNMEVASERGNYLGAGTGSFGNNDESVRMLNPSSSTRVRGLVGADNTRNYFRTTVAWDTANVGRIDILRGPNSILFGLGSPGGVVNATTDTANLRKDSAEVGIATDQFGSFRGTAEFNKVLAKDQFAIRGSVVVDRKEFRQKEAYEDKDIKFLTATYRPSFLNRNGMTFALSADYEGGSSESNRPRFAPPVDQFSPFITPTVIKDIQLPAGTNFMNYANGVVPGGTSNVVGYTVPYNLNLGGALPVGVEQTFDGNGAQYVVPNDGSAPFWQMMILKTDGVLNANGTVFSHATQLSNAAALYGGGYAPRIVSTTSAIANNLGHPFRASFRPISLTNASVFDFYNHLLDGPNKREWSDYDQARFVLSNTFLNQILGYEVSHFQESTTYGQTTLLGDNNRILVDVNERTIENQPNPYLGRAYIQETDYAGNRIRTADLEATRVSAYVDYDFRRERVGPEWLARILGRQVVNGVWMKDRADLTNRDFQRHVWPDELLAEYGSKAQLITGSTRVTARYYISDDLRGTTNLGDVRLSGLTQDVLGAMSLPMSIRTFDTTWTGAANSNPNAIWVNGNGQTVRQAQNPANYVGWTNKSYTMVDALSGDPADLDRATRNARLQRNTVDSKAISWQGYLFDGALVGTAGWREDKSRSFLKNSTANPAPYNSANLDPAVFNLESGRRDDLTVRSKNYSVVAHLHKIPFLRDRLPLHVSLTYNQGENFDPTAGRLDLAAESLPPPSGQTEEYGVLLATKDGRYALKAVKYETQIINSSTGQVANQFRLQQFLGIIGAPSAAEAADGTLRAAWNARATKPSWNPDDQENLSAPAWYAMESELVALFPNFASQWLTGGTFAPSNANTSFAINNNNTADTISRGYEIEFTANPTRQLRLAINASKTEAMSDNVPGKNGAAVYEFIHSKLFNPDGTPTAAGQLRNRTDQFGTQGSFAQFWMNNIWGNYQVVLQKNGQLNTELVEWRVNALANYTFTEGRLKGLGIGGSVRWEGERSIGYPNYFNEGGYVQVQLDNPYRAPSNLRSDLTLSYRRKLTDKIDWRIQLNLYNAFGENKLVPAAVNPDGTYALYRIQEGQSWRLSNTFSF